MSDKSKPIDVFESEEQLLYCLKWWQDKLFLNDWVIDVSICEPDEFILSNVAGENELSVDLRCAVIRILDYKHHGTKVMKYCAEKTLVHELLHCKYNWVNNSNDYNGKYVDTMEHSLLEQMAKSLIMVKYNIGLNYFVNV